MKEAIRFNPTRFQNSGLIAVALVLLVLPGAFAQGLLTPPGAPAPNMKSLTQVFDQVTSAATTAASAATNAANAKTSADAATAAANTAATNAANATTSADSATSAANTAATNAANATAAAASAEAAALAAKDPRTAVSTLSGSGFSVHVISQPGSYYLTANITAPADMNGIQITTSGVTLDLSGFAVSGPGKSVGSSGSGIYAPAGNQIRLVNGTVRDFRSFGVYLNQFCIVSNVIADSNGIFGIAAGYSSEVTHCVGSNNGAGSSTDAGYGITAGGNSTVTNNVCWNNDGGSSAGSYGMQVGNGSVVSGNVAYAISADSSNAYGIRVFGDCVVKDNAIYGIQTFAGGTVFDISFGARCVVTNNVCSASAGGGTNASCYGLYSFSGESLISGNTCSANNGTGTGIVAQIRAAARDHVEGNLCTSAAGTTAQNYGILAQGNSVTIVRNTGKSNGTSDIHFDAGTSGGYAGGNLTKSAITQGGGATNNLSGTTPAPNVVF